MYSSFKLTQFNIQIYAIQHSTFENTCFRYPTASHSMTASVGSANYQNSSLVGASKGRSLYPRQWLLPRKMAPYIFHSFYIQHYQHYLDWERRKCSESFNAKEPLLSFCLLNALALLFTIVCSISSEKKLPKQCFGVSLESNDSDSVE